MLATEIHQTSTRSNPGWVDSHNTGPMYNTRRSALDPMVGQVLPKAWNIDEQLKITPLATKFHELIMSMVAPTAITGSSSVNTRMNHSDSNWQTRVSTAMIATLISTVQLKVSRTRSGRRAPKF